jgi:NAD(P)-dependent dehydrogenase (short-subunit alcohol dehydrogenase family)
MSIPANYERLEGQTAIITGGARGLGLAIAQRLSAEGCRVILWDRDFSKFDPVSVGLTPLHRQTVDVADLASVTACFEQTLAVTDRVDILVNNAGINGPIAPAWEYPVDSWDRVLAINLTGVFYCCRTVLPHMRERGYGRVVNVASIAGKEGNPGGSAYAASKGGVIAYTKSASKELAQSGVLMNCIAPTMAETELLNEMTPEFIAAIKAKIPMGRFITAQEVAATVAFAASKDCSFTTGFTFDLTGGRATY